MIKVFVVEDEPLILRTIKQMIEQTHNGFKVVGEALNGEVALALIETLKPDVVFTDIRIPIMDGLTLITKLRKQNANVIIVVLSGYQEFEYAQKALKLGVTEYLLKPLSQELLKSLLDSIFKDFYANVLDQQTETMKKAIGNKLSSTKTEDNHYHQLFNFRYYHHLLICAGSFCFLSSLWITPAKDFWIRTDLKSLASKHIPLENSFWVLESENNNEKIIVYGNNETNDDVKNIFEHIHSDLTSCGFQITSIFGGVVSDILHLGIEIQKSRIVLNKCICFAKSNFISAEAGLCVTQNSDLNLLDSSTEKTLNILIQNTQPLKLKSELHKLLELCEKNSFRQLSLERFVKHLINMFYMSFGSVPDIRAAEIDMEVTELISASTSYKSLYEGICFIVDDLFRLKNKKNETGDAHKNLMDQIELYIKSNFCKPINLQTLSEKFGLVPPYLSRVYKKAKGLSPNDFIIMLRIEKTKELLLLSPPAVLTDIAEAVGFNDRFYLSKVFKSVTGKTPSEFRAYYQ